MLNTIISFLTYELEESLAIEILAIFLLKKWKTFTIYGQKHITTRTNEAKKEMFEKQMLLLETFDDCLIMRRVS